MSNSLVGKVPNPFDGRPPNDVAPSELWSKLNEPSPSEVIDFPRKDRAGNIVGKIRIKVLRMEDHNKARLRATKSLKQAAKDAGIGELSKEDMDTEAVKEVLGDLIAQELLCMACYTDTETGILDPFGNPTYAKVFHNPQSISAVLSADETLILFNQYRYVQYMYGPFEKTINDDDDIEAWLHRLKEGGSAFPLLALPLPQLVDFTYCLSEKISTLCQILASQQSNLPDTLKSALLNCFTATFLYGERLNSSTQVSEETSPKIVDMELAAKMAQSFKESVEIGM